MGRRGGLGVVSTVAKEPIVARYETNAGNSFADDTFTVVDYEDQVIDTHSAVTTGASWVFTAPRTAYYNVTASIAWSSTGTFSDGVISIRKNSTDTLGKIVNNISSSMTDRTWALSGVVQLNAGDTLDVRASQNDSGGSARTLEGAALYNHISIASVG